MRRDHHTQPFDVEADEADDVTKEFWGASRGWISREHPSVDDSSTDGHTDDLWREDTTGSLAAIRDGVRAFRPQRIARRDATGDMQRTRQHGIVARDHAPVSPQREASLGELADGRPVDAPDDFDHAGPATELVPLSPVHPLAERLGVGAVDPLLVRVGMVLLIASLLVPLALALRPSAEESIAAGSPQAAAALIVASDVSDDAAEASTAEPASPQSVASPASESVPPASSDARRPASEAEVDASEPAATEAPASQPATASDVGDTVQSSVSSNNDAAAVSAGAERVVPECPTTYVAGPGDSWYRIADGAGVPPSALLDENLATAQTVIQPGDDICLPAGATMPTQPTATTAAPATTVAPAATPVTTAPATTAPVTTAPATTQPPVTSPPASSGEVQQMIRDIWPDELEEKALQIAWRESNYKPNVYNGWCCYGVFQIYWTVHDGWLDNYGINSSSDLYDARKNITAAYALYQQSGGWGPWGG